MDVEVPYSHFEQRKIRVVEEEEAFHCSNLKIEKVEDIPEEVTFFLENRLIFGFPKSVGFTLQGTISRHCYPLSQLGYLRKRVKTCLDCLRQSRRKFKFSR